MLVLLFRGYFQVFYDSNARVSSTAKAPPYEVYSPAPSERLRKGSGERRAGRAGEALPEGEPKAGGGAHQGNEVQRPSERRKGGEEGTRASR